jgi:predicted aspartyl protease
MRWMGTFSVDIQVGDPRGQRFERFEALVDPGASYTTLAASRLHDLGVIPMRRQRFVLANGEIVVKDVGETRVRIDGREGTTVVVFGDEGAGPLLGAVTLEQMGLGVWIL